MGLKERIDRLEKSLNPDPEDMLTVILDLRSLAERRALAGPARDFSRAPRLRGALRNGGLPWWD